MSSRCRQHPLQQNNVCVEIRVNKARHAIVFVCVKASMNVRLVKKRMSPNTVNHSCHQVARLIFVVSFSRIIESTTLKPKYIKTLLCGYRNPSKGLGCPLSNTSRNSIDSHGCHSKTENKRKGAEKGLRLVRGRPRLSVSPFLYQTNSSP